jgi:hypothetical protein
MNLVIEMERTGVLQSTGSPPAERRVVRIKRCDSWVEHMLAVHGPQIAMAAATLIVWDLEQALVSLVLVMAVRALPHVSGKAGEGDAER